MAVPQERSGRRNSHTKSQHTEMQHNTTWFTKTHNKAELFKHRGLSRESMCLPHHIPYDALKFISEYM